MSFVDDVVNGYPRELGIIFADRLDEGSFARACPCQPTQTKWARIVVAYLRDRMSSVLPVGDLKACVADAAGVSREHLAHVLSFCASILSLQMLCIPIWMIQVAWSVNSEHTLPG